MVYLGSKSRIAKDIVPIIQSYITSETKGYLEPFVGGANIIDKIECDNRIGCDIHKQLIALLNKVKDGVDDIPDTISEEEYKKVKNNKEQYEDWYLGLVGFCASFGAKYFGGYARDKKGKRNIPNERIRNLKRQASNLKNIKFINCDFRDIPKDKIKGYVIYCDIPYKNTTKYKTDKFPYEEFYQWVNEMAKDNIVLISEYNMPEIFRCIWQKESKVNFCSTRSANEEKNKRIEKLFLCNAANGYIYE
ncbi:MAG: hypothetical protein ACLR02_09855 [Clostridium sp.]